MAVLDDEPDITQLLATYLGMQGFRVSQVHEGAALMALMHADTPQLILLDLGLPGEDGFAIARTLREHWRCGLVIVSGRGDAIDKVVGLEIGADDYVTKPFDLRELLARIKAVLRRLEPEPLASSLAAPVASVAPVMPNSPPTAAGVSAQAPAAERLSFGEWTLDIGARRLLRASGAEVSLTAGEFDLLEVLVRHAGRVLSRDFLLERTRGREAGPFDRTIDVQVGRLRKKLDDTGSEPQLIKAVRGVGYLLVAP